MVVVGNAVASAQLSPDQAVAAIWTRSHPTNVPGSGDDIGSLARAVVAVTETATLEVRLEELRTEVARPQERPA